MVGKITFLTHLFVLLTGGAGKPLWKVHRFSDQKEDKPRDCHGDKNCQGHTFSQVEQRQSVKQEGFTRMSRLLVKVFDFDFKDDNDSYLNSKSRYVKEYDKTVVKAEVRISLNSDEYNYKYYDEVDFTDDEGIYEDDKNEDYYDGDYDEEVVDDDDDDGEKDDDENFDEESGNSGDDDDDDDEDVPSASAIQKFLFEDNDKIIADKPIVFEPQGYRSLFDDILDSY